MLRVRDADISENVSKIGPMPSDLTELIHLSLSKHREERFQTAGEFYQALIDFCFRHGIKVSNSDLSNFMRRLFAEEIEQEKTRRRAEPHANNMPPGLAPWSSVDPIPPVRLKGSDTIDDGLGFISSSGANNELPRANYRYRAADGNVHGPMTLASLVGLVKSMDAPSVEDRVYVEGRGWVELAEISELSEAISVKSTVELSGSVLPQHGAQIFRHGARREPPQQNEHEPALADTDEISGGQDAPAEDRAPVAFEMVESADTAEQADLDASASAADVGSTVMDERPVSKISLREVEALRETYNVYEGELENVSFTRLLSRLHRARSTGRLVTGRGDVEKATYFQDGEIILVDSNRREELLGSFLTSRGIITEVQLRDGLDRLSEWGGRLGDALVAVGAIPAHDIFRLLSEQMSEKLLEVFDWGGEGIYGFFENQEPEKHGYPLDVDCYDVIVTGSRDRVKLEWITSLYRERMHVAMHMREPSPSPIERLKLRGGELRVLKQIESGLTLHGLLRKFPPSQRSLIYRTVYLLHQIETLTFEITSPQPNFPGIVPS